MAMYRCYLRLATTVGPTLISELFTLEITSSPFTESVTSILSPNSNAKSNDGTYATGPSFTMSAVKPSCCAIGQCKSKRDQLSSKTSQSFYGICLTSIGVPQPCCKLPNLAMALSLSSLILSSALITVSTLTLPRSHPNITHTLVCQFPNNGSWIGNVVQRSNGNLLVTRTDVCRLYFNPISHAASLVSTFLSCNTALSMTEIAKDVFVILIDTINLQPFSVTPKSFVT